VVKAPAVFRLVAQLIGGAAQVGDIAGGQAAVRFPQTVDALVAGGAACSFRAGGRSWHTDGLRQGKNHSFSLLVGVALSDTDRGGEDDCSSGGGGGGGSGGNLCVWPGSHVTCRDLMRFPDGKVGDAISGP